MQYVIEGYEPRRLFEYFEEISAIPRSSGEEKAVSDFLVAFARAQGLEVYQDAIWNVVIKKAGSVGCEQLPAIMLQGHLDMVCEKNAATKHDFASEGLKLWVDHGQLRAKGTTLGADNGIAVALMMAILTDDTLRHPPLECVFTVQEETGLTGAAELAAELLTARTMINLDSEEEGIATVSCAGGQTMDLCLAADWQSYEGTQAAVRISIGGLLGGHSGSDIHLERGNANLLMGRLLAVAAQGCAIALVSLSGGNKDNAIARECEAVFSVPAEVDLAAIVVALEAEAAHIRQELAQTEPDFCATVTITDTQYGLSTVATMKLIKLLMLAPNGVLNRNVQAGGFVVCSVNLGVIRTHQGGVDVTFSLRSSMASLQSQTVRRLTTLAELLGFSLKLAAGYPGWAYAQQSPIRDVFCSCYEARYGQSLKCEAIHAGLECGLFSGKLPGLDAIAVGPQIANCHTPDEQLDLASSARAYTLLTAVLDKLTR